MGEVRVDVLQWETDPLVTTVRSHPSPGKCNSETGPIWWGTGEGSRWQSHTCHSCPAWPLHSQQDLFRVLKAYTLYRPEEGYCQAQAPIAAVLLMHMPAEVPPGLGRASGWRAGNSQQQGLTSLLPTASLLVPGADL